MHDARTDMELRILKRQSREIGEARGRQNASVQPRTDQATTRVRLATLLWRVVERMDPERVTSPTILRKRH